LYSDMFLQVPGGRRILSPGNLGKKHRKEHKHNQREREGI